MICAVPSHRYHLERVDAFLGSLPHQIQSVCKNLVDRADGKPLPVEDLIVPGSNDASHSALIWYGLDILMQAQIFDVVLMDGSEELLRLSKPTLLGSPAHPSRELSAFTRIYREADRWVMETPFGAAVGTFRGLFVIQQLSEADRISATVKQQSDANDALAGELLELLHKNGFLNDKDYLYDQWDYHDLLFHAKTRGNMSGNRGGTYRFLGSREPEPAFKENAFGNAITLPYRSDGEELSLLTEIARKRMSHRRYGIQPMSSADLGTFLRRVAEPLEVWPANPADGLHYDTIRKHFPGGGGCHELELYPIINRCDGLERGIYWYNSRDDKLQVISGWSIDTENLISRAGQSMGISPNVPDVLICVSARFGRLNWKYEGIVYSTALKNFGAMLQWMYLVATTLGLAPCAVGAGDSKDFVHAAGIDPSKEDVIGEIAIGSR